MQVRPWSVEHERTSPASGRELEGDLQFSQVLTFRKGKVVLIEFFWDHQEALEAAGLEE
ncbi:MAG: hypothetical protein ACRELU_07230 [Gemmatimonadota bacterium]